MSKDLMKSGLLIATILAAAPAAAQQTTTGGAASNGVAGTATTRNSGVVAGSNQTDARETVNEAVKVVKQMKRDPQVAKLLARSKGVYIVPDFARGGLVVGAKGGSGLMLAHLKTGWSDPVFYDFGGISVGAQAGASAGSVAFILMSQQAVDAFKSGNKVSLNAGAGLSIINYSANAQASWGKGDIVLWSDTEGAYAGATVSVSDMNWDDNENSVIYGKASATEIIGGKARSKIAAPLKAVLPK